MVVVTTGIRDARGNAIGVAEGLRRYDEDPARNGDPYYRGALQTAEDRVRGALPPDADVAALSVFTTQSFSHIVERLRDAIGRAPAPTLNFNVGPDGARAVFDVSKIAALTHNAHMTAAGTLTPQRWPMP